MSGETESSDLVLNLGTGFRRKKSNATKKEPPVSDNFQQPSKQREFPVKRNKGYAGGDDDEREQHHSQGPPRKKQHVFSALFDSRTSLPEVEVKSTADSKNEPVFSSSTFSEFEVHSHIASCLRDRFGVTTATEVQKLAIPVLLRGKDALIKSHTGSGKTLAYAVPVMHRLQEIRPKLNRSDGVRAVVVVPTRELALQTYECFEKLSKACTWVVPGMLTGGEKKKSEKARLRKGLSVVIGTPGRLVDHLEHTESFTLAKSTWLVIDEADRLLELGFEETVSKIVSLWKEQRQDGEGTCVLLSATLSKGVERLAGLALNDPAVVDVAVEAGAVELEEFVLPPGLSQFYLQIPVKLAQMALSCLLLDACVTAGRGKVIVFLATQDSVDFQQAVFSSVLGTMLEDSDNRIDFVKLHGDLSQHDRAEVFRKFREAPAGVLFTTDVASRGLDVPQVDLIVQCSVPLRPEDYVHRAGRTARIGAKGKVVLLLFPSEVGFLDTLADRRIHLQRMDLKDILNHVFILKQHIQEARIDPGQKLRTMEDFVTALQLIFETEVYAESELLAMAKKGFLSHVRSYASYPKAMREVVSFKALHLGHLAKAYCLREPPSTLGAQWASQTQGTAGGGHRGGWDSKDRRQGKTVAGRPMLKKTRISEYDSGMVATKKKRKVKES